MKGKSEGFMADYLSQHNRKKEIGHGILRREKKKKKTAAFLRDKCSQKKKTFPINAGRKMASVLLPRLKGEEERGCRDAVSYEKGKKCSTSKKVKKGWVLLVGRLGKKRLRITGRRKGKEVS